MKTLPNTITPEEITAFGELEITYKTKEKLNKTLKNTNESVELLRSIWSNQIEYREEVVLLLLNRAMSVIGWIKISAGGTASTVVDVKMIMQAALLSNATALILCHNHPSGNFTPSEKDISLTKKIIEAGKILEITVLDHIILTRESHYSFADEGMM